MDNANTANAKKKTDEIKQAFLSSAISDISAYIQLADTKVSIIIRDEPQDIAVHHGPCRHQRNAEYLHPCKV